MSYVRSVAVCLALCGLTASAALAQAPALNPPVVSGANITFSWSATAGATSYNLLATLVPGGPPMATFNVGNVTSIPVTAPATGAYYVRVQALPGGETSNEVTVAVTSLVTPPAAPVGLQAFRNGTGVLISWQPGGGGPAAGYNLRVGTTPGGSELGVIPTGATGLAVGGGVPAGVYYLAVSAVNAGGASGEATTVLNMPAGGACDAPPAPALTTTAWGSFLTANWSPVPGAVSYLLSAAGPGISTSVALRRRHHQLPLPRPAARDVELRHPGAVLLRRVRRRGRFAAHRGRLVAAHAAEGSGSGRPTPTSATLPASSATSPRPTRATSPTRALSTGATIAGCSASSRRCANATSAGVSTGSGPTSATCRRT